MIINVNHTAALFMINCPTPVEGSTLYWTLWLLLFVNLGGKKENEK